MGYLMLFLWLAVLPTCVGGLLCLPGNYLFPGKQSSSARKRTDARRRKLLRQHASGAAKWTSPLFCLPENYSFPGKQKCFTSTRDSAKTYDSVKMSTCVWRKRNLGVQWLWGQFCLWAGFQVVAVYVILKEETLDQVAEVYTGFAIAMSLIGLLSMLRVWIKGDKYMQKDKAAWTKGQKLWLLLFLALWLLQMLAVIFLAVNDGDDAYYMAVASVTESSGELYTADVYAYGGTELNYRYALAPFPVWIAFLSRISGVHTLIIGHIILGIMLITMSYVIYAEIATELFGANMKKRLQFLVFVALLTIWGNTSSHMPASFLLLRSRQGKALVAGIVFPAIVCLLIKLGRCLEQQKKIGINLYIKAATVILSGCLGSTMGGVLVMLLWGSGAFFLMLSYLPGSCPFSKQHTRFASWHVLPAAVLSVLPGMVYAVLYFLN